MNSPKLVLKRFHLGQNQPSGAFLEIQGRAPGLLSFFLNLMGLDPTTTMTCYPNRIEVSQVSLAGKQAIIIPMSRVTAIVGGHAKPLWPLVVALFLASVGMLGLLGSLLANGDAAAFIGSLVMAAVFMVAYILGKSMNLYVQNGGDKLFGVRFGQGVIEGVPVDIARVQQAVEMVNQAVIVSAVQSPPPTP